MTTTATDARDNTATHSLEVTAEGMPPVAVTFEDRRDDRPILLLHGGAGPASVRSFSGLLASRQEARVITPTHPGFDGTARPDSLASMRDLARLNVELLDALDLRNVTLAGNSIGGWLAAEIALLGSPRVGAAVLIDAVGAEVSGHPVTDVSGLTPPELMKLSFHSPERFIPGPDAPAPSPELVAANMAALMAYGGAAMQDPTLLERLSGLDLPVRVIWGAADGIVSPDYGRAYADAIPGARFTLIEDAGHLPQLETPDQLLAAMTEPSASQDPS